MAGEGEREGESSITRGRSRIFSFVIERAKPGLYSGRNGSRAHDEPVYDFAVSPWSEAFDERRRRGGWCPIAHARGGSLASPSRDHEHVFTRTEYTQAIFASFWISLI